MLEHPELGEQLKQMLISVYDKLFETLNPAIKKEELETPVYIRVSPPLGGVVALNRSIIEALLILISTSQMAKYLETSGPVIQWLGVQQKSPNSLACEDVEMSQSIEINTRLLQRLIRSGDLQASLALKCAKPHQLLELVQTFGLEMATLTKIFEQLGPVSKEDIAKSGIKELPFLNELLEFYEDMGIKKARSSVHIDSDLHESKDTDQKPEVMIKIKNEPI